VRGCLDLQARRELFVKRPIVGERTRGWNHIAGDASIAPSVAGEAFPGIIGCDLRDDVEYDKLSSTRARWSHSVDTLPQR
jgi:hypothetical protein